MWKGDRLFVSEVLAGELLGIAELETGDHVVRFYHRDMGLIDRRGRFTRFAPPREGPRVYTRTQRTIRVAGEVSAVSRLTLSIARQHS